MQDIKQQHIKDFSPRDIAIQVMKAIEVADITQLNGKNVFEESEYEAIFQSIEDGVSLAVEQDKECVAKELNELYTEFENEPLPVFSNISERNWNEGFKQGRLTAIEKITQKLTGKDGDELLNLSTNKE